MFMSADMAEPDRLGLFCEAGDALKAIRFLSGRSIKDGYYIWLMEQPTGDAHTVENSRCPVISAVEDSIAFEATSDPSRIHTLPNKRLALRNVVDVIRTRPRCGIMHVTSLHFSCLSEPRFYSMVNPFLLLAQHQV